MMVMEYPVNLAELSTRRNRPRACLVVKTKRKIKRIRKKSGQMGARMRKILTFPKVPRGTWEEFLGKPRRLGCRERAAISEKRQDPADRWTRTDHPILYDIYCQKF